MRPSSLFSSTSRKLFRLFAAATQQQPQRPTSAKATEEPQAPAASDAERVQEKEVWWWRRQWTMWTSTISQEDWNLNRPLLLQNSNSTSSTFPAAASPADSSSSATSATPAFPASPVLANEFIITLGTPAITADFGVSGQSAAISTAGEEGSTAAPAGCSIVHPGRTTHARSAKPAANTLVVDEVSVVAVSARCSGRRSASAEVERVAADTAARGGSAVANAEFAIAAEHTAVGGAASTAGGVASTAAYDVDTEYEISSLTGSATVAAADAALGSRPSKETPEGCFSVHVAQQSLPPVSLALLVSIAPNAEAVSWTAHREATGGTLSFARNSFTLSAHKSKTLQSRRGSCRGFSAVKSDVSCTGAMSHTGDASYTAVMRENMCNSKVKKARLPSYYSDNDIEVFSINGGDTPGRRRRAGANIKEERTSYNNTIAESALKRRRKTQLQLYQREAVLQMVQGPYPPFLTAVPLAVICRMLARIWEDGET